MNFNNFQDLCKEKVVEYFNERVEKTDNTKSLSAAVNVTDQDEKELKELSDLGVKVYIQQVPTSPSKVLFE